MKSVDFTDSTSKRGCIYTQQCVQDVYNTLGQKILKGITLAVSFIKFNYTDEP